MGGGKKIIEYLLPMTLFLIGFLIGQRGRRCLYNLRKNYDIAKTASIGNCFLIVDSLTMGDRSRIGDFTIIRNLESLILESDSRIGTFNWIFGHKTSEHFVDEEHRESTLALRKGSSLTSRHIVDCTDRIEIGQFSTVAGFRSQILTHAIDTQLNRQTCSPVQIGQYCFVGTGSILLKGSHLPDKSILAAGSVLGSKYSQTFTLYSGSPAKPVKELPKDSKYMVRLVSHVR